MKKLTNDPSRNVNAVSGMWVRLRKDGSKYDVRYVNARVRRVWSLSRLRRARRGMFRPRESSMRTF